MYHSTEQNGFDNSELIKYIVASFHLLVKPQGSDSGPFGTGCVNMIFSNDPF